MRNILLLATVLIFTSASVFAGTWEKYISKDPAFSFHYPAGWSVKPDKSTVEIANPSADEQLTIVFLTSDKNKTPTQLANDLITAFKPSLPDLKASNWHSEPENQNTSVSFSISYSEKSRNYSGDALVAKSEDQVYWFSFSGPESNYSQARALKILEGLIGSLSSGSDSKPPAFDFLELETSPGLSPQQIQKNADAFVFVLEFALGAPLSAVDEKIIQTELKKDWATKSAEELKQFDEYPNLVKSIMTADQEHVDKAHTELEASTKEWLDKADDSDKSAKIIRSQLEKNKKILVEDSPSLSELSAQSYSEMMAFAELLYKNPKSNLSQITPAKLGSLRKNLISSWSGFSEEQKNTVVNTPSIWIILRQLLKFGSPDEQAKVRTAVRGLYAPSVDTPRSTAKGANKNTPPDTGTQNTNSKSAADEIKRKFEDQRQFNNFCWGHIYSVL